MVDSSESVGPQAGDVLGRYQLLIPIAKGGMGQVWVARLTGTRGFQKLVALKTILPSSEDVANLETMLFDEASLAAQIHHPNVAETLDLGEQNGTLYLVMEWVYGEPLDRVVRAARRTTALGGVPNRLAIEIIAQGCRGLHAAHVATDSRGERLGIVHRDVSPQNLLITYRGTVKLVDFGVAKATQQMARPTTTGEVKGKFAYMAPEQVHGEALDARADVFAMGIVLYWLTTGEHPFRADNAAATLRNIMCASPALPATRVPGYSPMLQDVIMKALARDKTQRFASAHEMMLALEAVVPRTERVDGELQEFMERLFADRLAERTAALEAALQAADAGLAIASGRPRPHLPVSQPTMRAVAVEYGPEIRVVSEAPAAEPGERDASPPPRRKAVQLALAAAAGAMLVAGAFRLRQETGARAPANANANANANASGEIETSVSPSQPLPSAASLSEPSLGMAPPADADGHADAGGAAASSSGASRAAPVKRHDRPLKREVPPDPSLLPAPPRSAEPAPVVDPLNRRR